jgi:hypothetical protein
MSCFVSCIAEICKFYHCRPHLSIYEVIEPLFLQLFGGHQFCCCLYQGRPRSAVTTLERRMDSVGNFYARRLECGMPKTGTGNVGWRLTEDCWTNLGTVAVQ